MCYSEEVGRAIPRQDFSFLTDEARGEKDRREEARAARRRETICRRIPVSLQRKRRSADWQGHE